MVYRRPFRRSRCLSMAHRRRNVGQLDWCRLSWFFPYPRTDFSNFRGGGGGGHGARNGGAAGTGGGVFGCASGGGGGGLAGFGGFGLGCRFGFLGRRARVGLCRLAEVPRLDGFCWRLGLGRRAGSWRFGLQRFGLWRSGPWRVGLWSVLGFRRHRRLPFRGGFSAPTWGGRRRRGGLRRPFFGLCRCLGWRGDLAAARGGGPGFRGLLRGGGGCHNGDGVAARYRWHTPNQPITCNHAQFGNPNAPQPRFPFPPVRRATI